MGFLDIPLARAQAASTSTAGTMSAADKALLDTATHAATGDSLAKRYSSGSLHVVTGTSPNDAANKGYVDAETAKRALTGHGHAAATSSADGFMAAADKTKLDGLSGDNLIGDGGFNTGMSAVLNTYNGTTTRIVDALKSRSGNAFIELAQTTTTADAQTLFTGFPVHEGRTYRITAWARTGTGANGLAKFAGTVTKPDGVASFIANQSSFNMVSTAWTELSMTYTIPAGSGYGDFSVRVLMVENRVVGNSLRIDDVYAVDITEVIRVARSAETLATGSLNGFMNAADKAKLDAAGYAATVSTLALRSGSGNIAFNSVQLTTQSGGADATRKDYVDAMSQKAYRAYTMADAPTVYGPGVTTFLAADTDGWNWGNGQNFANVVTAKSSFTGGTTQWAYPYRSETLPPLVRYWKDAATAWGPWHTMASQAYVDKISAGAAVASDAAMGKLVAFGFENSEMTARGYTVSGATMTPLPGVAQLANANSSYGLRDPSIARMNGNYYLAATKPLKSNYLGTGATAMQLHVSNNLADWTPLADIPAGVTGATRAWAPELFVDGPDVYVYYSVTTDTTQDASLITTFDIYARKASNPELTAWGSAVKMTGLVTPKSLDAHVTRADDARGKYVMFFKDETNMNICRAWAGSPLGPWTTDKTGAWLGHATATEGPQLMRLPGGTWRLFYDRYVNDQLAYRDSTDLDTWTAETTLTYSPRLRHPGYLWLTPAESNALATRHRAVRAYTGAAISIPHNALTAVPLSNSQGDTAFWSSANPTRFTADAPGWYSLSFTLLWTSNATGQRSASMRFSNGAVIVYKDSRAATTGGMGTEHGGEDRNFFLAAGEYVEVMGLQLSGAALTVNAVASFVREG